MTRTIERHGATLRRFREVRYESLLDDPVDGVVTLLDWMGLPTEPGLRAELETRSAERVSRYNTSGEIGSGKWTAMPAADLRTIYRHAGDRLVELGYLSPRELARIRSRPSYRLDAVTRRLRRIASRPPSDR